MQQARSVAASFRLHSPRASQSQAAVLVLLDLLPKLLWQVLKVYSLPILGHNALQSGSCHYSTSSPYPISLLLHLLHRLGKPKCRSKGCTGGYGSHTDFGIFWVALAQE